MTVVPAQQSGGAGGTSGLYDVIELILDRGLVIDAFVRVSLVGIEILKIDAALETKQIERVRALKGRRDSAVVQARLGALKEAAARDDVNLMPAILDAARDYVTMGEMCEALREVWGTWRETPVF